MRIGIVVPTWDLHRGWEAADHYSGTCATATITGIGFGVKGVLHNMLTGVGATKAFEPEAYAFLHDDVLIYENGWGKGVEDLFTLEPKCGVIGFGGALGLGTVDIYKVPYDHRQLARQQFYSNLTDHEIHGAHLLQPARVSVLDGFCMIVRKEAYEDMGGWEAALSDGLPPHHMYDIWLACMMAELGWETWAVPVRCTHRGGITSCSPEYQEWLKSQGWEDDRAVHQQAHKVIYDRFRRVLPLRLKNG